MKLAELQKAEGIQRTILHFLGVSTLFSDYLLWFGGWFSDVSLCRSGCAEYALVVGIYTCWEFSNKVKEAKH